MEWLCAASIILFPLCLCAALSQDGKGDFLLVLLLACRKGPDSHYLRGSIASPGSTTQLYNMVRIAVCKKVNGRVPRVHTYLRISLGFLQTSILTMRDKTTLAVQSLHSIYTQHTLRMHINFELTSYVITHTYMDIRLHILINTCWNQSL